MKKQFFLSTVICFLLFASLAQGQFRIHHSDLLRIGNVNETPLLRNGFEVSMSELLLKSGHMGFQCYAAEAMFGKLDNNFMNLQTGIRIQNDTVFLTTQSSGIKLYVDPDQNFVSRSIGINPPVSMTSGDIQRLVGYGKPLMIGSAQNQLVGVYSTRYYSSSATGISSLSDARYKTNIRPMENAVAKIMAMNPVRFDYRKLDNLQADEADPARSNRIGFIAQELQEVCPEAVDYNMLDDIYSVDYSVLIPFLVKAVQEQQAEIERLKEQLAERR